MTAKQYLSQIEILDKRIKNKISEECQLRSLATCISGSVKIERVQNSGSGDRIGNIVAKIVDVQSEMNFIIEEYLKKRSDVIKTIENVSSVKLYELLFKRYIEYKRLEEISSEMGYSIQHVKRLHGEALKLIDKMIENNMQPNETE